MAVIQSGASTDLLTVDPTSKAARITPYDSAGNLLAALNRAAVIETLGGLLTAGKDYKLLRTQRQSSTGGLHVAGDGTMMLIDSFEGTTRNLNRWIETIATATSAQTLATGLRLNTGSSLTSGQGVLESSHRQFPIVAQCGLAFRARLRFQGATNCFQEWGFSDQASVTTPTHNNGAFFRRDGAGSLQPVLAFNGAETQGSVMTGPATTEYAYYEIFLEDDRATFQVISVTGVLLASQVMERGQSGAGAGVATQARLFAVTHLPAMFRVYNSGAAGTAPQIDITLCSVTFADGWSQRDHRIAMSGMGLNSLTSPTVFTQLANYANSAAPASATLSNTAAGYTTLGGQWQFAAVAGAETDFALFGWQNPTPYTFNCTGILIHAFNMGAAVATTAHSLQWGAAFNSSAVSLATAAPYSPMRVALGQHGFLTADVIGASARPGPIDWRTGTPMAVQPGRFLHIILKMPTATATASQIIRGTCVVDGFFE